MIKTNAPSCLQLTTLGTNPKERRLALFGALVLCVTLPIKALAQMNATPPQIAVPALVGLWDFSGIRRDPDVPAESVDVRVNPSTGAAVIARLDEKGIPSADGSKRFCSWAGDNDFADPVQEVASTPNPALKLRPSWCSSSKANGFVSPSTTPPRDLDG